VVLSHLHFHIYILRTLAFERVINAIAFTQQIALVISQTFDFDLNRFYKSIAMSSSVNTFFCYQLSHFKTLFSTTFGSTMHCKHFNMEDLCISIVG